jgi:hypothetical protein
MSGFGRDDPCQMPSHFFYHALRLDYDTAVRAPTERQNCSSARANGGPFTVAVVIPTWLARRNGIAPTLASSPGGLLLQLCGLVLLALGLLLFAPSLGRSPPRARGRSPPATRRRRSSCTAPTATYATR